MGMSYAEVERLGIMLPVREAQCRYRRPARYEMCIRDRLGSTPKMGAGTNVQDRLIAIHNLDCPWRPSDAVSYTHLDVYKRQAPVRPLNRSTAHRLSCTGTMENDLSFQP